METTSIFWSRWEVGRSAIGLPHRDREGHSAHVVDAGSRVAHIELELRDFLPVVVRALRADELHVLEEGGGLELLHESRERLDIDGVADEAHAHRVVHDLRSDLALVATRTVVPSGNDGADRRRRLAAAGKAERHDPPV